MPTEAEYKICSRCKTRKLKSRFHKQASTASGIRSWCKKCVSKYAQGWRKQKLQEDPFYWRVKNGNWKTADIIFTSQQYLDKLNEQKGRCAICGKHQSEFRMTLNVDHNHKTKQVRGLVCTQCNHLIGVVEDRKQILNRTEDYLSSWNKKENE